MNTFITFGVIFITTSIALLLGPLAIRAAKKIGLVDDPSKAAHKIHANLIPVVGGVILALVITTASIVSGAIRSEVILAILAPAGIVFAFGLWDDYRNLPPVVKISGQLLAALVMIFLGLQVQLFQQNWLNLLLTVFWIVGVTNAYNFVDSMDGLAIGLASLASAFFMLITSESQQASLSYFSTILLGASLGVYYYNAPPAKIFIGDSGAQLMGFILGGLAIAYNPLGFSRFASWYLPILLMGVPIFDTTLVVVSRLRRRKPVYRAGRDHTYHRLVRRGMSPNRAVLTMHMIAMVLGALAFIALELTPILGNLIFALVLASGLAGIIFLDMGWKEPV